MKIEKLKRTLRSALFRKVRRIVVLVVGIIVLIVGVVLIFIPGPAFVVIPAGFAILATEFQWARKWVHKAKDWPKQAKAWMKAALSPRNQRDRGARRRRISTLELTVTPGPSKLDISNYERGKS